MKPWMKICAECGKKLGKDAIKDREKEKAFCDLECQILWEITEQGRNLNENGLG